MKYNVINAERWVPQKTQATLKRYISRRPNFYHEKKVKNVNKVDFLDI